jgi:hypothetical protein
MVSTIMLATDSTTSSSIFVAVPQTYDAEWVEHDQRHERDHRHGARLGHHAAIHMPTAAAPQASGGIVCCQPSIVSVTRTSPDSTPTRW